MPTKVEKDSVTGHLTTGHEWDGLTELNRPLPKWWLYVLYATIVVAIAQFILYPSWPGITGYWHGLLGYSTRKELHTELQAEQAKRAAYMDRIRTMSFAEIQKDPQLLEVALTDGRITFAENCQPCHGAGGGGNPGYPALAAGNWFWGGSLQAIQQTVTYGIRSGDPNARDSQMPRFGADGILKPEQIQHIADYVMTLFGKPVPGADITQGKKLFADNCAVCHGDKGQGNRQVGAPALASRIHLHVSDRASVVRQISNPVMGVMPNWNHRLDEATIKAVTLYVHSLGGGE